eukprot:ctg_2415.g360
MPPRKGGGASRDGDDDDDRSEGVSVRGTAADKSAA